MKKSKKGFTLVEIIVVLVIIAILAAIAIPAMTGWIDKANDRANYAEARTVLLAAQTLASEQYATSTDAIKVDKDAIASLSGIGAGFIPSDAAIASGKVTSVSYTNGGRTLTWNGTTGQWTKTP